MPNQSTGNWNAPIIPLRKWSASNFSSVDTLPIYGAYIIDRLINRCVTTVPIAAFYTHKNTSHTT